MGGRYLVSGSQLGMLITYCKIDPDAANQLLTEIIEKQFINDSDERLLDDLKSLQNFFTVIRHAL